MYYRCTRLLMATEFPDDPEVDLGFRDPATENSIPKTAQEWNPQMELRLDDEPRVSKERLSNPWWSLRITIILFLSAFGGLVSSIFLFERAERPSIAKHWKRDPYTTPKTSEESRATVNWDFRLDQLPASRIEGDSAGLPTVSQAADESPPPIRQPEPFNATVRLPLGAPPFVPFGDFSMNTASETVVPEKVVSENATQTKRTVRATTEKMRKHRIVRFRRRAAKRVVHSAKSIASFWALVTPFPQFRISRNQCQSAIRNTEIDKKKIQGVILVSRILARGCGAANQTRKPENCRPSFIDWRKGAPPDRDALRLESRAASIAPKRSCSSTSSSCELSTQLRLSTPAM